MKSNRWEARARARKRGVCRPLLRGRKSRGETTRDEALPGGTSGVLRRALARTAMRDSIRYVTIIPSICMSTVRERVGTVWTQLAAR